MYIIYRRNPAGCLGRSKASLHKAVRIFQFELDALDWSNVALAIGPRM